MGDILAKAREQVLERGVGLDQDQVLAVLQLPDDRLDELLALADEVRMAWCGPEVEVEGIISLKTAVAPRTAISVRSQDFSHHRCAAPGSTFRAWWKPPNRPPSLARPSSASWPPCADPMSGCWPRSLPASRRSATRSTSRSPARWAC